LIPVATPKTTPAVLGSPERSAAQMIDGYHQQEHEINLALSNLLPKGIPH
jgi:hypothetical protein